MNTQRRKHERRQDSLLISLANDAHDCSGRLFSPEVADMNGSQALANDAEVSGLAVDASDAEGAVCLDAALIRARRQAGAPPSVRLAAYRAAQAGMTVVRKLREAPCR